MKHGSLTFVDVRLDSINLDEDVVLDTVFEDVDPDILLSYFTAAGMDEDIIGWAMDQVNAEKDTTPVAGCPFCGSGARLMAITGNYHVKCDVELDGCGAEGPVAQDRFNAVTGWNRRS